MKLLSFFSISFVVFCLFCLLVLPYYVVNKVEYNSNNSVIILNTIVQNTTDYSVDYTTIDSYCKSKSAVALSLNVTHNWFDDIRNFCSFVFVTIS